MSSVNRLKVRRSGRMIYFYETSWALDTNRRKGRNSSRRYSVGDDISARVTKLEVNQSWRSPHS